MAKWPDPSERCRELARREREIYGQQELPDLLEHMAEECARLRAAAQKSAAHRDEAERRAEAAEERLLAVEAVGEELLSSTLGLINAGNRAKEKLLGWRDRAIAAEAELARIRAADRTSITVRTETAAQMRKGQAI